MKLLKIEFKPEITFGNICQMITILGAAIGYLIHNEVRATKQEARIDNHETRLESLEVAKYPMYQHTNNVAHP